jgi:TPR repeat protein
MRTHLLSVLVPFLVLGCGKAETKEEKFNRVCKKLHAEEVAACAGSAPCLDEANEKLELCQGMGKTIGATERGEKPKTLEDQVDERKTKCDSGDQEACAIWGGALLLGKDGVVEKDEAKGFAIVQKSCEAGNATGCEILARAYERGLGVPADEAKFHATMEKACGMGSAGACRSFALSFDDTDPKRIPLLEKACTMKDTIGCMGIGAAYLHGNQGTKKDLVKAKKYLQMACDLEPDKAADACAKAREI